MSRVHRHRADGGGRPGGRWWRVAAASIVVTAGVVSCGDDGGDDRSSAATTTTPGGDTETDAAGEVEVEAQEFVTRPDLRPPVIDVAVSEPSTAGLIFLAPKQADVQKGALIVDDDGEVVWASPSERTITDLRVQTYRGEPVLTWWEGRAVGGYGDGEFVIANTAYEEVARFPAGNGRDGDMHELQLTDDGTALILVYESEPADLTPVSGPTEGHMLNAYVQEIDIRTGRVVFEWSARDHVPVTDTYSELVPDAAATDDRLDDDGSADAPFDWFHVNSVSEDDDTLLVSARNTQAIYAIDRHTGQVRWTLGGKNSDFTLDDDATFTWQHDARRLPDGTISLFDNQGNPPTADESRALVLDLDTEAAEASLVRELGRPDPVLAGSQGNTQILDDGSVIVGWGSAGGVTHFDPDGNVVFDATWAPADSYRVYRQPWTGQPTTTPDVATEPTATGEVDVYVSWNGATEVAEWRLLAGADPDRLEPTETTPKDGFETTITIDPDGADYVAVQALDATGAVLATSEPQPTT